MVLISTMTFDDEDPDLHVHFTDHARELDEHDHLEWLRLMRVLEDALVEYAGRVRRVRQANEDKMPGART